MRTATRYGVFRWGIIAGIACLPLGPVRGTTSDPPAEPESGPMAPVEGAADEGLRLNFKDARLADVLNYLSEAAGFVVVQEVEVSGTVTVTSHQPLDKDEAVELLAAVLARNGYAVLRNGRMLRIVDQKTAHQRDLPVRTARRAKDIPRNDEMVTQIIPVRFADAKELLDNLSPLLGANAKLTANESSNAIVLTDTQANVRRMAEIIEALDTSISAISTVRVFPLRHADAKALATIIKDVFQSEQRSSKAAPQQGRRFPRFFMRGGGGGERGGANAQPKSRAQQAAMRVIATADENSNALIVSAPDDLMPTIEQLITEIDADITEVTEVRVFHLQNADSGELAQIIDRLYAAEEAFVNAERRTASRRGRRGNAREAQATAPSRRAVQEVRVVTVSDPRTNTLLVQAPTETMPQIAELIQRLDAGGERKQRVYVYPLHHADVDKVAEILRGMFGQQSNRRNTSRGVSAAGANRLTERATRGASTGANNAASGRRTR